MKFTYDFNSVNQYISSQGYTLLNTEYISSQASLNIKCPKGHIIHPCFSEFKRKARCNECSGNKKPTLEYIQEFIKPKGFTLLSKNYINNSTKLELVCEKGHPWQVTWINLKSGNGCNACSGRGMGKKVKLPVKGITHPYALKEVEDFYSNKGYSLLSKDYTNNKQQLDIQCDKGHTYSTSFAVSKKGFGCPSCSGNKPYTFDEVKEYITKEGYQVISTFFQNKNTKLSLICPKGHNYITNFAYFQYGGYRCNSCSHQTSRAEQEIMDYIKQYYPNSKKVKFYEIIQNCDKVYKNKELDIYIPELRVAIEYCGLFWHSEASGEKKSGQHINKMKWCRENGIRLITIFEDEWLTRKDQVKNLLLSIMGSHTVKIGARKCKVVEIDKSLAKSFINCNHIQELNVCSIAFGLFFQNELIGVITGAAHHRQNQNSFVLQRLCFKQGYQIAGGASKLLKYLKQYAKSNNYKCMVSWSDNRISEGNVYSKLGFTLKNEYHQDYYYVLDGYYEKKYGKQGMKKTKEEQLTGKTEAELRKEQGYYRIWDCGKKLWSLDL